MKVLLISNMYPSKKSYFGIFIKNQENNLIKNGVKFVKAVRKKKGIFTSLFFYIEILFRTLFNSYDIIHAHYGFHSALIPAVFKRKPLVITFHGSDALREPFRNKMFFYLQTFVIKRADRIIAVSHDIKSKMIERLDGNAKRISVISCGVDTKKFYPINRIQARIDLGLELDRIIILFVGKLTYMKGVDIIYKAAKQTKEIIYLLAGEGELKENIPNCKNIGPIENKYLPKWMNAADIFILPSRSEGTPVVMLESMSCGTPVIASDVGGCPDLIEEGVNGYLIRINKPSIKHSETFKEKEPLVDATSEPEIELKNKIMKLINEIQREKIKRDVIRQKVIKSYDDYSISMKIIEDYRRAMIHRHGGRNEP